MSGAGKAAGTDPRAPLPRHNAALPVLSAGCLRAARAVS
jgi:hypothetical protein